ncbi:MAG: hypothetical protein ACTSXH_06105 [Promethearchaeota archaeon]
MTYKFNDSENERYRKLIESEFLNNPNPFPRNPVCSRDNLPKFCLGRDEEIGIIKNGIEKVATSYSHKSAWIPLNGSGGTGKSTIALYVYDSVKNKKSRDLDIDFLECAYIESPSNENYLNLENIYKRIIHDLGKTPGNFPYLIGFNFIKKFCNFIENEDTIKNVFINKFSAVLRIISKCKDSTDLLITLKNKAPNFARDLKYFVKEYDFVFLNNENINLPIEYIEILIDLVSDNTRFRLGAYNEITGENLNNAEKAIDLLKNLIAVLNFLSDKSCLLIIIDNLENLPEKVESSKNLFRLLLKFRNEINNCLILTIGSSDFWEFFNRNLNTSELNMITGFKFEDISLTNLSERDASRIMNRNLTEFWNIIEAKYKPKGSDSKFPFSLKAFQYLYEINDRNLRDSLKQLNKIVEKYKVDKQINYLKNTKDSIYYLRPNLESVYLFENEINFLNEFLSTFTNRNQLSRNIEFGLMNAFNVLQEKSPFGNLIYKVKHEPNIPTIETGFAKPDIYLTLFGRESIEDIKNVEIQVKAYFPSNKVKIDEIKGSLALLKERKIHYLTFISLSELDDRIIQELMKYGPQVGRVSKLNVEESSYLMLLTKEYSNLFFKKDTLDFNSYIQIFAKLDIKFPAFFDRIKSIELGATPPPIKEEKAKQEKKVIVRPKTPDEKISNPSRLEEHIVKLLKDKKLIRTQQLIINEIINIASSQNVIKNAMSNLKERKIIAYSRKSPQGWKIISES